MFEGEQMTKVICKIKRINREFKEGDLFYDSEKEQYYMLIKYCDEYNLLNLSSGVCRNIFIVEIKDLVDDLEFVARDYKLIIEENK